MADDSKPQDNPLYGATPRPTDGGSTAPPATNTSSPETRIPEPEPKTTNPLFGATPPPSQLIAPPRIPTRSSRLPLSHPSGLPSYLRRLGYILSSVLGSSAAVAGIWSAFILPLLHASFSARRALVDQQNDRWAGLVAGLKEVRARSIYPPATEEVSVPSPVPESKGDEEKLALEKVGEEARLIEEESTEGEDTSTPNPAAIEQILPLNTISSLSTSLANLVTAFTSTSTTRTSLLSTLESYTSHLHRQLYLRSTPGSGGMRYGMNTLSANLAKAGGGKAWGAFEQDGEQATGVKGEEWDAVRKEVRAIKGMLLSRRNFVVDGEAR